MENMADVTIQNHGTVLLFSLHTNVAQEWAEENMNYEPEHFREAFRKSFPVEHRFAHDVAQAMLSDGLQVK